MKRTAYVFKKKKTGEKFMKDLIESGYDNQGGLSEQSKAITNPFNEDYSAVGFSSSFYESEKVFCLETDYNQALKHAKFILNPYLKKGNWVRYHGNWSEIWFNGRIFCIGKIKGYTVYPQNLEMSQSCNFSELEKITLQELIQHIMKDTIKKLTQRKQ